MSDELSISLQAKIAANAHAQAKSRAESSMEKLATGSKVNSASDDVSASAMLSRVDRQILGSTRETLIVE